MFAQYEDIAFSSAQGFGRLAGRYLRDVHERADIAASMREAVVDKFTYGALVDELLAFIDKRIADSPQTH